MQKRKIGNLEVSAIGLGCMRYEFWKRQKRNDKFNT